MQTALDFPEVAATKVNTCLLKQSGKQVSISFASDLQKHCSLLDGAFVVSHFSNTFVAINYCSKYAFRDIYNQSNTIEHKLI